MKKDKVVVIGGGIAGIFSALLYSSKGYKVALIEKEATTGGLLRSQELFEKDLMFDYGTHLLSSTNNKEIDSLLFDDLAVNEFEYLKVGSFYKGLYEKYTEIWNEQPNIDFYPLYLVDWRYPQFLATKERHQARMIEHDKRFNLDRAVLEITPHNVQAATFDGWAKPEKVLLWNQSLKPIIRIKAENRESITGQLVLVYRLEDDVTVEVILNGIRLGNFTASENNSGSVRTANIIISENGGDLSTTLVVNQSLETFNIDNAIALTGLTVTGVGTQAGDNIPKNTLDGNESTRWSANSSDGSAYLTYDLQCKKTVTSVKIYFHKGDTRTSSFKIATSNDGTNFTEVTAKLTSSGNIVGFEDFTLNPYQKVRYVRILGYGNSENSGWNSYEEVQIFGDDACASLNVANNLFIENGFTFYPNPANNFINISFKGMDKSQINYSLLDIRGAQVLIGESAPNNGLISIGTSTLPDGFYILTVSRKGQSYNQKLFISH